MRRWRYKLLEGRENEKRKRRLTSYFRTSGPVMNLLFMFSLDKDDVSCLHYFRMPHPGVTRAAREVWKKRALR